MEHVEGHSGAAYITTRRITLEECPWIGQDIEENEILYPYYGYTYGCIAPTGVAISREPGKHPFLEVPRDAVRIVGVD